MKILRIITCVILATFASTTLANDNNPDANDATAKSKSGAIAAQGQSTSIDSHNSSRGSDLGKMVPNVMAPSLTTTLTETCMGSTSFGGSGSGFGFSFGTTWRDSACVRRLDARQLAAFNDMGTAREIMCASSIVREAAKRSGRPCVEDGGLPAYQLAQPAPVAAVTVEEAAAVKVVDETAKSNQLVDDGSPVFRAETPTN